MYTETDTGHGTHLTINRPRDIKTDQVKNHCHEGCHARKGVNLRKE